MSTRTGTIARTATAAAVGLLGAAGTATATPDDLPRVATAPASTTAYPVAGAIRTVYDQYGGAAVMGDPTTAAYRTRSAATPTVTETWRQDFTRRTITWTAAPGVGGHTVYRPGGIGQLWLRLNPPTTRASDLPRGEEFRIGPGSVWRQDFQQSSIYSGPTGTWRVGGAILNRYWAEDGSYSKLGLPTGAMVTTSTGWQQDFQFGRISAARDGSTRMAYFMGFNASVRETRRSDVALSWRSGCPVGPSQLRVVDMNFWGFDGRQYRGRMVVNAAVTGDVTAAFRAGYAARFPLTQMRDPSAFGNDDYKSMAANNTYAFSCRPVTGSNPPRMSPHSYGMSVDINPVQNPYRQDNGVWAPNARYSNRSLHEPGMLYLNSAITQSFNAHGWGWLYSFDTQHFQKGERNR